MPIRSLRRCGRALLAGFWSQSPCAVDRRSELFGRCKVSGLRGSASVLAASLIAVLMIGVPAVAGSPFSALVGTWSGKGTARLEGGKSEKLSCKGYYSGSGGTELKLNIICANPSTKVELELGAARSRVVAFAGELLALAALEAGRPL